MNDVRRPSWNGDKSNFITSSTTFSCMHVYRYRLHIIIAIRSAIAMMMITILMMMEIRCIYKLWVENQNYASYLQYPPSPHTIIIQSSSSSDLTEPMFYRLICVINDGGDDHDHDDRGRWTMWEDRREMVIKATSSLPLLLSLACMYIDIGYIWQWWWRWWWWLWWW